MLGLSTPNFRKEVRHMNKTKGCRCGGVVVLVTLFASVIVGTLAVPSFAAQDDFPKKEITMICSMAAGGGRDLLSRGVAKTMSKYLKVPVVVTNIAGAGGVLELTNSIIRRLTAIP